MSSPPSAKLDTYDWPPEDEDALTPVAPKKKMKKGASRSNTRMDLSEGTGVAVDMRGSGGREESAPM
jgi:hypothetical protein